MAKDILQVGPLHRGDQLLGSPLTMSGSNRSQGLIWGKGNGLPLAKVAPDAAEGSFATASEMGSYNLLDTMHPEEEVRRAPLLLVDKCDLAGAQLPSVIDF